MSWTKLENEAVKEIYNKFNLDIVVITNELNKLDLTPYPRTSFAVIYKLANLDLITLESRDNLIKTLTQERKNLKNKDFFKVKRIILKRDNKKCAICDSIENLNLAHIIPYYNSKKTIEEEAITLCKKCHKDFDKQDSKKILFKIFLKMKSYYPYYGNKYRPALVSCNTCNKNHHKMIRLKEQI